MQRWIWTSLLAGLLLIALSRPGVDVDAPKASGSLPRKVKPSSKSPVPAKARDESLEDNSNS
jgi:hypothetical protein